MGLMAFLNSDLPQPRAEWLRYLFQDMRKLGQWAVGSSGMGFLCMFVQMSKYLIFILMQTENKFGGYEVFYK